MRMLRIAMTLTAAAVLLATASAQSLEAELQRTIQQETVTGDLKTAIEEYSKIVARAGSNRAVAAKALIRMAECYQKLGDAESHKIYDRVLREYADQREAVAVARARLGRNAVAHATGIVTRQVWAGPQVAIYASVSPDGRSLAFVDQMTGNLTLHALTAGKDRPLTNKRGWEESGEYAEESTFSPDGKRVAYAWFNKDGRYDLRIAAVESSGASPHVLYSNEEVAWIAPKDWSLDGKWIATRLERKDRSLQLGLIGTGDGSLRVLKSVGWSNSTSMSFSPNGQYLAFDLPSSEDSHAHDVFVIAVDGSRELPVVVHPADDLVVGWTPDGKHLLFTSDRTGSVGIYALPFEDGRPRGAAKQIKADIGQASTIGLTRSGVLYFGLTPGSRDFFAARIDFDSGRVLAPAVPAVHSFLGTNYQPDWSPDGRYLSYASYRRKQAVVLAIRAMDTGQTRELRPRLRYFNFARWSPDGRSFVTQGTDLKGRQGIYRIDAQSGEVDAIVLSAPGEESAIPQWAPDGKRIFYRRGDPARKNDSLMERELASGAERELLRSIDLRWFSVAPDGSQLACATVDPATKESAVSILAVAGGERRHLLRPSKGFTHPMWTPDGRFILLRNSGELWAIASTGGEPRKIDLGVARILDTRVHPDGQRIAFLTRNSTPQEVWVMENLLGALNADK
jgi:Tol biopolymer transport system component